MNVCSLSGGETSTFELPRKLIEKFGRENVDFVFCDTGAEHPDTYRFIRDTEKYFDIKVTCLKLVLSKEAGVGASYKIVDSSEIKQDYYAWKQLTHKYGNPFIPGGKTCTDQMKSVVHKLYCNDKYGKGNYFTWIGYRYEEGNRIWGKKASDVLGKAGLDNKDKADFYIESFSVGMDTLLDDLFPSMFPSEEDDEKKDIIRKAMNNIDKKKFRFLPLLSKSTKSEIKSNCKKLEHKLNIDPHLTNCVFCPEKPHAVVMLAIKDEPEMAEEFLSIVESSEVPEKIKRDGSVRPKLEMYRNRITFRQLYEKAMRHTREEIASMSRIGVEISNKNPCSSGECSPFGDIHEEQIEILNL